MTTEIVVVRKRVVPRVKRGDIIEINLVNDRAKFHVVNVEYGDRKTLMKLRRKRHRGR